MNDSPKLVNNLRQTFMEKSYNLIFLQYLALLILNTNSPKIV